MNDHPLFLGGMAGFALGVLLVVGWAVWWLIRITYNSIPWDEIGPGIEAWATSWPLGALFWGPIIGVGLVALIYAIATIRSLFAQRQAKPTTTEADDA